jgi:type IV secretion system protein TrbC
MNADHSRSRMALWRDFPLLVRRIQSRDQAVRLARVSGWLIMLAGVIVLLLGFLLDHQATMIEGTLVTLLALLAGWGRSRIVASVLALLLLLGWVGGLMAGALPTALVFQFTILGISLRLVEASFRFRK